MAGVVGSTAWVLTLTVDANQYADDFPCYHTILLVQSLKFCDQLHIGAFETWWRHDIAAMLFTTLFTAETQPVRGHTEPVRQRAQFFLRRNGFADQPFARRMHRNRTTRKAHVEFPQQAASGFRESIRHFAVPAAGVR